MKVRSHPHLLAALVLLGCFGQAQAQNTNRSVTPVPPRPAPTNTTPAAPATTPTPATTVPFTPPLDGTVLMPGTAIGTTGTAVNNYTANPTAAMGAGGGANAPQVVPSGAGPYTPLQLSESFLRADANRDGELSRAEFQRLTIAPASFEEMDRDRNGVVTRSEYDDGTR